jgi:Tfp pilus assembly protein PilV
MGIGLLAIAQLVPLGLGTITQARVRTNAVQAAQQRIDDIRSADFSSVDLAAGTYTETLGNYTLNWTITDDSPVPGSKRISMTATWQHLTGAKTAQLVTYVSAR